MDYLLKIKISEVFTQIWVINKMPALFIKNKIFWDSSSLLPNSTRNSKSVSHDGI
jgi:hypothetical protein